ncbi:MAG: redoxin domain-containing protein [Deltaproteobacteria bacterium]|nr:redoxin domain-containing protein [Deltaproteobacteria bacterium]RLB33673.1 MAG: hypothetical protein DRH20_13075 [Deltaproteobacteria bacterium]
MGFRDLYGEFQNLRAVILGVSPDGEASHRKFIDKNDLPFPLLSIYGWAPLSARLRSGTYTPWAGGLGGASLT